MPDDPKIRLFTALELPEEWRRTLARWQDGVQRLGPEQLKLVRPELMHVTLVFLGYQDPEELPSVDSALLTAGRQVSPFTLGLGSPGFFGRPASIEVIWVGLADPPRELLNLHAALLATLSLTRITLDNRPLVPHIAIARGKRPMDRKVASNLHSALQSFNLDAPRPFRVKEFVLMQSRLSRQGPSYEVLRRYPLGGSDG